MLCGESPPERLLACPGPRSTLRVLQTGGVVGASVWSMISPCRHVGLVTAHIPATIVLARVCLCLHYSCLADQGWPNGQ